MFVRHIRRIRESEDLPGEHYTVESLYECKRIHMEPQGESVVLFTLEENDDHAIVIHMATGRGDGEPNMNQEEGGAVHSFYRNELYIMNSEGKTIDSYRW